MIEVEGFMNLFGVKILRPLHLNEQIQGKARTLGNLQAGFKGVTGAFGPPIQNRDALPGLEDRRRHQNGARRRLDDPSYFGPDIAKADFR